MTLKETFEAMKADTAKKAPAEALEVMLRSKQDLINSDIPGKALKSGDNAPQFKLYNAEGKNVNSADILASGPMVLIFYRGAW